ncbi:MAG: nucleoside hydrolase [Anaerolineaceae bacterium]|nr:nucleoside hydrolase [Anaerolineaceae bacterium]
MPQKHKVILDLAAGVESAIVQIVAASTQEIGLVGVATAWGALPLTETTEQALRVFELLGKRVPVYAGCPAAIAKGIYKKPDLLSGHNKPGAMVSLGSAKSEAAEKHAVQFIIDTCRESEEKVTLIGMGPLTNFGMALSIAPDIVHNINEIVIVGGGVALSDITATAEKNIWFDPEAAQMVINSGAKVVIIPIDISPRMNLDGETQKTFMALDNPIGEILRNLQKQFDGENSLSELMLNGAVSMLNAVISLAYLVEPLLLCELQQVHLQVCLDHNEGAGTLLIDRRRNPERPNAYLVDEVDPQVFTGFLKTALTSVNAGH